jgi:hypothetical protein
MILRSKLRTTVQTVTRGLACGLVVCAMFFAGLGCTGGAGDAAPAVDAARGTGDDDPVVDESADDGDAGGDTTTTE